MEKLHYWMNKRRREENKAAFNMSKASESHSSAMQTKRTQHSRFEKTSDDLMQTSRI